MTSSLRSHDHRGPDAVEGPESQDMVAAPESTGFVPVSGLLVGAAGDPAEAEADRMADRALSALRRSAASGAATSAPGDARETPAPAAGGGVHRTLRRSTGTAAEAVVGREGGAVPADLGTRIERSRSGGEPLAPALRRRMETAFDADLGGVRVHRGAEPESLNRALSARAFTTGSDIYFGEGAYRPGTAEGDHVIAHEIAHTRQNSGVRRSVNPALRRSTAGAGVIRRLDAGVANTAYQAMTNLDYPLLSDIAARATIVQSLAAMMPGDQTMIEPLKQMVLVSPLKPDKIAELIAAAAPKLKADNTRPAAISQLSAKLRKGKVRSSAEVYALIESCRKIHTDYYRDAYQVEDGKSEITTDDLRSDAKKYDEGGKTTYEDKLKTKKKGFFGSKTVKHTLGDVVEKVKAVANLALTNTHAPDRSPGVTGEAKTKLSSSRPRVGVVGAGPVGLMAALESRLQGADVFLFESRASEYTRRQVLALDPSTMAKLSKLGVKFDLLDKDNTERAGEGNLVAVRYIEDALRTRALELGIDIRTGWSFTGADRGEGKTQTTAEFSVTGSEKDAKPTKEHIDLDLLVLAAGPGVTRKGKDGAPSITDKLGFTFDVQEAKDYAAVGLFEPTQGGRLDRAGASSEEKKDWSYRFNTPKITYVLQQIPKELFEKLELKRDDPEDVTLKKKELIREFIGNVAKNHYQIGDAKFGPTTTDKGAKMDNVGVFPIEVQQARKVINDKLGILLIGDTAATPHPHSGSGFNTGVRELDALSDVVGSLRGDILSRLEQGGKGKQPEDKDKAPEEEAPSQLERALHAYNDEVKVLTDQMIAKALRIMAKEHSRFMTKWMAEIEQKYGSLLASDFANGQRFEAIKGAIGKMNGPGSTTDMQIRIDYLMDARREVARIEKAMHDLKGE